MNSMAQWRFTEWVSNAFQQTLFPGASAVRPPTKKEKEQDKRREEE